MEYFLRRNAKSAYVSVASSSKNKNSTVWIPVILSFYYKKYDFVGFIGNLYIYIGLSQLYDEHEVIQKKSNLTTLL